MNENGKSEGRAFSKGDVYRVCRQWHGYLSAFAFLALIFFAATGILLNHPGLLEGQPPPPVEHTVTLTAEQIATVKAAAEPGLELATVVGAMTELSGSYRSGEIAGDDVYANLQGVRGRSDLTGNLATGEIRIYSERESAVGLLNGLHRGEHAGDAWRALIDVMAGAFIVMSLIGYALFLSLRFRLRTALALTAASLLAMAGLFVFATA